jgi:hypothetical protein
MRRLIIKFLLFVAAMEGLAHVNFMVLLSAMGVAMAIVICSDLFLVSASSR